MDQGFPQGLQKKVYSVLGKISKKTYNNVSCGMGDEYETYLLLDSSTVTIPARIYFIDDEKAYDELEDKEEKLIYDCIFTRSCDGYVRQRHLRNILADDFPEWCMPYILKLSVEYVVEIVDDIYKGLRTRDNAQFRAFCANNPYMFRRSYTRMVSYWNEFYRQDSYNFHSYVGYRLYKECFGYSRKYERLTLKEGEQL